jgi:hypothetical protein
MVLPPKSKHTNFLFWVVLGFGFRASRLVGKLSTLETLCQLHKLFFFHTNIFEDHHISPFYNTFLVVHRCGDLRYSVAHEVETKRATFAF